MTIKHKVFAAYSVLKADDVNGYLMNQTCVEVGTVGELASVPAGVNLARVVNTGGLYVREGGSIWNRVGAAKQRDYATGSDAIRVASGSYTAAFNAISYVYSAIDFASMGFTAPPHIVGSPSDGGSSGVISVHFSALTAAGCTAVTRTTGNITASIGVNWIAIGT